MRNVFIKKRAFTLLELIVVMIIIGVMAALALPKLALAIEYSKISEALVAIGSIRAAVERCSLWNNDYSECQLNVLPDHINDLDIENPTDSPGSIWGYRVVSMGVTPPFTMGITAWRTDMGANEDNYIYLEHKEGGVTDYSEGGGIYQGWHR